MAFDPSRLKDSPATAKQLYLIKLKSGIDYKKGAVELTQKQAHELIQRLMDKSSSTTPKQQKSKKNYEEILAKANKAADDAAKSWLQSKFGKDVSKVLKGNSFIGYCGFVYAQVTDRRSAFYKWLIETDKINPKYTSTFIPLVYTGSNNQCHDLKYAAVQAAIDVFVKENIPVSMYHMYD